jgi:hypothetical protein
VNDTYALSTFQSAVRGAILTAMPAGLTDERIHVNLAPGSVRTVATIFPSAFVTIANIEATLSSGGDVLSRLRSYIAQSLSAAESILNVSTGPISVSSLTYNVVDMSNGSNISWPAPDEATENTAEEVEPDVIGIRKSNG